MNVWLTPDTKPFVGGTYFPPDDKYGQPGLKKVLKKIAEAWKTDRDKIVASSDDRVEFMKSVAPIDGQSTAYVCENFVCQLPTTELPVLANLLAEKKPAQ